MTSGDKVADSSAGALANQMRALYARIAEADTKSFTPQFQSEKDLARRATDDANNIGDVRGLQVLEVGPGYGHLARELAGRGARVSCLDLVPTYLNLLTQHLENLFVGDVQEMLFQDCFDVVVMRDVLEHVLRPADALLGAFDALRPGGMLYVRSPAYEPSVQYSMRLGQQYEAVHLRTFTPELLDLEVRAAGFRIVKKARGFRHTERSPQPRFTSLHYWSLARLWLQHKQLGTEAPAIGTRDRIVYALLGSPTRSRLLNLALKPIVKTLTRPLNIFVVAVKSK